MAIQLININSELGAGTRGASLGVQAMKVASWNKGSDYFNRHPVVRIQDENDFLFEAVQTPHAKYAEGILNVFERMVNQFAELAKSDDFPIVLAGDHSTAAATISGLKAARPNERLGVVWVDAHGDLHTPYSSPSGNMHGMPLAMALAEDNVDRKLNDVSSDAAEYWEKLKNIGGISPKIQADDLVFFGVRDTEEPEDYLMDKKGIKNYTVAEVRYRGLQLCVAEALERLKDCDSIYISFDVDSMDCGIVSHGTGTPVYKGFDQEEVTEIMKGIIDSGKVRCFEVVEVNPTLDEKQNKMAEVSFDVLENITEHIEQTRS
jgi:arginase